MLTDKRMGHLAIVMAFLGLKIIAVQAMETEEVNLNETNSNLALTDVHQDAQTIEEDVKSFCTSCLSFANTANSALQQMTVTTLMLTQNLAAYEELLGKGLNATNIEKFQKELRDILEVTSLNSQEIKMIQNVIASYPTPGILPPPHSTLKTLSLDELKELKEHTQPFVTRALLLRHPTDLKILIDEGMTIKNFRKKHYLSRIMTLAGFSNKKDQEQKKHISLVKNVLKLEYGKNNTKKK